MSNFRPQFLLEWPFHVNTSPLPSRFTSPELKPNKDHTRPWTYNRAHLHCHSFPLLSSWTPVFPRFVGLKDVEKSDTIKTRLLLNNPKLDFSRYGTTYKNFLPTPITQLLSDDPPRSRSSSLWPLDGRHCNQVHSPHDRTWPLDYCLNHFPLPRPLPKTEVKLPSHLYHPPDLLCSTGSKDQLLLTSTVTDSTSTEFSSHKPSHLVLKSKHM